MARSSRVERRTKETEITINLTIEGRGEARISTGLPFLDHMLNLFTKHGLFDIEIQGKGDLEVDYHHTVDDVGITLGQAFKKALGDMAGLRRFGSATVPMDEALVTCAVDISGRPYLVYNVPKLQEKVGSYDWELTQGFLKGFVDHLGCTLHILLHYGTNGHHVMEGIFKGLGRALDVATSLDDRTRGVPSTKGSL